ncbi:hypothetical protein HK104_000993 [Borealophlyctis nickersoniae]|nr:hypothetical protein HK104_000993 [Borealophlyctis nickersoniae]
MNVDAIFKAPLPQGSKRKMPPNPDDANLKKAKTDVDETDMHDEEDYRTGWGPGARRETNHGNGEEANGSAADGEEDDRFHGSGLSEDQQRIWDIVDAGEEAPATVDLPTLKKMVLKFERAINKNQELRVKYPDDPMKFINSEADLDDEIKTMTTVSAAPELYPHLVELGTHTSILSLLSHENTDIAIAAVGLMDELTDEDVVAETSEAGEDGMAALVKAWVDNDALDLIVQNLTRLNENESQGDDKQGVFSTLSVIENFISVDSKITETVLEKTNFLQWLLHRIRVRGFDSNKQYASEVLAILLQDSRANRLKLGELGGVGVLLQVTASYKKKDPKDPDEIEMMENVFDCLCSVLAEPENKRKFVEEEGLELMLIMIKEKKMSRMRALKVLDHALLGRIESREFSTRFVEILGLKTLFAVFMQKGMKKYKKEYKAFSETEADGKSCGTEMIHYNFANFTKSSAEHVISILSSLFRNLPDPSSRTRLVLKFIENDFEKLDRLMELHQQYSNRVAHIDEEIQKSKQERESQDGGDEDEDKDDDYLKRLDGGLFVLQLVDFILGYCCVEEEEGRIQQRVRLLLERQGRTFEDIKRVLKEYADNTDVEEEREDGLGEESAEESTVSVKDIILAMIERL